MKTSKPVLIVVALISLALLGAALYLQFIELMLPCPLCIMQRYAFAAIAIICLITAILPVNSAKAGASLGVLAALSGAGVAVWHIWIQAHPNVTCGIDPLETSLNTIPTAKLLPFLFQADGMCTTEYPPILGLSIPQWSLIWFIVLTIVLIRVALRRSRY
jgi:disulfide bond formation protein DsbB